MASPEAPRPQGREATNNPVMPLMAVINLLQSVKFSEVLTLSGLQSLEDQLAAIKASAAITNGRLLLGIALADPAVVGPTKADNMWFGISYDFVSTGQNLQLLALGIRPADTGYQDTVKSASLEGYQHAFLTMSDVNWQQFDT